MKILSFDFGCAEQAARIYQDLKQKRQLVEAEDLLIGATALHHQLKLATGAHTWLPPESRRHQGSNQNVDFLMNEA